MIGRWIAQPLRRPRRDLTTNPGNTLVLENRDCKIDNELRYRRISPRVNDATVEPFITHTPWWMAQTMSYGRLWVMRGNFWCKMMIWWPICYEGYRLCVIRGMCSIVYYIGPAPDFNTYPVLLISDFYICAHGNVQEPRLLGLIPFK